MKPLANWVLVEPEHEAVSPLLEGTPAVELPTRGVVLDIGPDVTTVAREDKVLFPRWAAQRVNDLLLIKEGTIEMIVPPGHRVRYSAEL